jgi:hypothetical protein
MPNLSGRSAQSIVARWRLRLLHGRVVKVTWSLVLVDEVGSCGPVVGGGRFPSKPEQQLRQMTGARRCGPAHLRHPWQ